MKPVLILVVTLSVFFVFKDSFSNSSMSLKVYGKFFLPWCLEECHQGAMNSNHSVCNSSIQNPGLVDRQPGLPYHAEVTSKYNPISLPKLRAIIIFGSCNVSTTTIEICLVLLEVPCFPHLCAHIINKYCFSS